jgi:hypothetical protein
MAACAVDAHHIIAYQRPSPMIKTVDVIFLLEPQRCLPSGLRAHFPKQSAVVLTDLRYWRTCDSERRLTYCQSPSSFEFQVTSATTRNLQQRIWASLDPWSTCRGPGSALFRAPGRPACFITSEHSVAAGAAAAGAANLGPCDRHGGLAACLPGSESEHGHFQSRSEFLSKAPQAPPAEPESRGRGLGGPALAATRCLRGGDDGRRRRRGRGGAEGVEEEVVELIVHVGPRVDAVRVRVLPPRPPRPPPPPPPVVVVNAAASPWPPAEERKGPGRAACDRT